MTHPVSSLQLRRYLRHGMLRRLAVFEAGAARCGLLCLGLAAVFPLAQAQPALGLAEYLALVERGSPELAAATQQREIAEAETRVAGAYPNPELEVGAGPWRSRAGAGSGTASAYGFTQPIDLPSVRAARIRAAAAGAEGAAAFAQSVRLAVGAQARQAFFDLVRRKDDERLARENLELLEQIQGRVLKRVEVGEAPRFELVRAEAETLAARNALAAARLRMEEARGALRRMAGGLLAQEFDVRGELPSPPAAPPLAELQAAVLAENPALRAAAAERERAQRRLDQERALRAPQPALRFGESRDPEMRAAMVGLTLSIPLWDRREGRIAQALASIELAAAQAEQQRAQLLREIAAAHARLSIAQRQIATFEAGLLRSADTALQVAEAAYRFGERSFLEVLDAQRTLRVVRGDYNQARFERVSAWLEIDRLRALDPFRTEKP
jgi:cobalt-zinc-cadmium efflux system outer membrane protein